MPLLVICVFATFQDFDNDGWQDLLVTGDFGQSKMFWNNQNSTFTECTRECGIAGFQVMTKNSS